MSNPTNANSPTSKGWQHASPLMKAGIGVVGLGIVLGVAILPGLWASDTPATKEADKRTPSSAEPFRQASFDAVPPGTGGYRETSTESGLPGTGERQRRRSRLPPPIMISSGPAAESRSESTRGREAPAEDTEGGPRRQGDDGPGERMRGGGGGGEAGENSTSLGSQVSGGVNMAGTRARYTGAGHYVIGANTSIPCLPIETHNSAMGGFATCRVPEWIRGDSQRFGLLPPGSIIKGQIRGGMAQGQPRLGVLYREIVTSGDRFKIPMQALGVDAQGRSGLDADIETFFWETAGTVGLYALIQGVTGAIPTALGALAGGGGGFAQLNIGGAGQSLAATQLQGRMNRQPQAERDWSLPMFVTVGHDLDFADVCRDRRRINPMACPRM